MAVSQTEGAWDMRRKGHRAWRKIHSHWRLGSGHIGLSVGLYLLRDTIYTNHTVFSPYLVPCCYNNALSCFGVSIHAHLSMELMEFQPHGQ